MLSGTRYCLGGRAVRGETRKANMRHRVSSLESIVKEFISKVGLLVASVHDT